MPSPMTLGLIGSGETPIETAISLLEDLTELNDPVTVIIAANHFTDTIGGLVDFFSENDVEFDLVVSPDTEVEPKGAREVHKAARPEQKVVALLEKAEGDKRLVVLWDDEDDALVKATERAVDRNLQALDLTAGLESLEFDAEDEPLAHEEDAPAEPQAAAPEAAEEPDLELSDDLDALGVRALRNLLQERLGLPRKKVGAMDKAACLAELRGAADVVVEEPDEAEVVEADEPADDVAAETTVAQAVEPEPLTLLELTREYSNTNGVTTQVNEQWARDLGLARAIEFHGAAGVDVDTILRTAHRFKAFLNGEQVTAGRPRKDGSPAQPRVA